MADKNADPCNPGQRSGADADFARWLGVQFARILSEGPAVPPGDDPLDRTHFVLNDADFERFVDLIENPPPPPEGLVRLMARKLPWE